MPVATMYEAFKRQQQSVGSTSVAISTHRFTPYNAQSIERTTILDNSGMTILNSNTMQVATRTTSLAISSPTHVSIPNHIRRPTPNMSPHRKSIDDPDSDPRPLPCSAAVQTSHSGNENFLLDGEAELQTAETSTLGTLEGDVIKRAVLNILQQSVKKKKQSEDEVDPDEAEERIQGLVEKTWAKPTTVARRALWDRLNRWIQLNDLPLNANSAVLFVAATGAAPSALLTYSKHLSAMMGKLGMETSPLSIMGTSLRAAGAEIPSRQAEPMAKEDLVKWAKTQKVNVRLALMICWKTASRWGEVATLSSEQVNVISRNEVIVDWATNPKGRKRNPFYPGRWAVIVGDLVEEIASDNIQLGKYERLTEWGTAKLVQEWRREKYMKKYSAHSIKRGAISRLFEQLASGEDIREELISRLAKHSTTAALSNTTIRYGGNPVALARALRTSEVTIHL